MTVLEAVEVTKQYNMGEVTVSALQSVSFVVTKGEFVAVMGPSGSGKARCCICWVAWMNRLRVKSPWRGTQLLIFQTMRSRWCGGARWGSSSSFIIWCRR